MAKTPTKPTGSIVGDFIWNDANGNGIQEVGEQDMPGIPVSVYDDEGGHAGGTLTAADGTYILDMPSGQQAYIEVVFQKPQMVTKSDRGGDNSIDSDFDLAFGRTPLFTGGAPGAVVDFDAGLDSEGGRGADGRAGAALDFRRRAGVVRGRRRDS